MELHAGNGSVISIGMSALIAPFGGNKVVAYIWALITPFGDDTDEVRARPYAICAVVLRSTSYCVVLATVVCRANY